MDHLFTAQDRIKWAMERAKRSGLSPEQLAEKVGVTRPALLHWQKETTDVMSVGVGPLRAFAQATGVNLEWVLTGRGDPLKTYTPTEEIAALIDKLARLQREDPKDFRMLERLINSALQEHAPTPPPA